MVPLNPCVCRQDSRVKISKRWQNTSTFQLFFSSTFTKTWITTWKPRHLNNGKLLNSTLAGVFQAIAWKLSWITCPKTHQFQLVFSTSTYLSFRGTSRKVIQISSINPRVSTHYLLCLQNNVCFTLEVYLSFLEANPQHFKPEFLV